MLRDAGASFGSKMGWERPNFFAPSPEQAKIEYAFRASENPSYQGIYG